MACLWRKAVLCCFLALLIPISSEEIDECKAGQWRCGDRHCVRDGAACDGTLDCADGSDENLFLCRGTKRPLLGLLALCLEPGAPLRAVLCPEACGKWPEYCYYALFAEHGEPGTCIFPPFPIVGEYSVTDIVTRGVGPADFSLTYSCPAKYRLLGKNPRCVNGVWSGMFPKCVPASYSAVSDGSGKHSCNALQFQCVNGACVRREQRCDGADDCGDGSDEINCGGSSSKMCLLPAYPEHGSYSVMNHPDAAPGQAYETVTLVVSCNNGFELMGSNSFYCFRGAWSNEMAQCNQCGTVLTAGRQLREVGTDVYHARHGEIPWHAGIYSKDYTPYMQICGGSLVSTSVVISAAHCFWQMSTQNLSASDKYAVALGKIYRPWRSLHDSYEHKSEVRKIVSPATFMGTESNYQDDISLIFLSTPVRYSWFIQPICVDFSHDFEGVQLDTSLGKVAGWGLTSEDGVPSPVLNTKEVLHVDLKRCILELPLDFRAMVTLDKFCAVAIKGAVICQGDSGGGLAFPTLDGKGTRRYYLRGIVSTAPATAHKCNVKSNILSTRISSQKMFITSNLNNPP